MLFIGLVVVVLAEGGVVVIKRQRFTPTLAKLSVIFKLGWSSYKVGAGSPSIFAKLSVVFWVEYHTKGRGLTPPRHGFQLLGRLTILIQKKDNSARF